MDLESIIKEKIKLFISKNDLYMFPLHTVYNGICTCGNNLCHSPGKHPLLKYNWKFSCTNKIENINKWFAKTNVNYAIATGKLSEKTGKRLIVIDIDDPKHEFLKKLPKTFCYKTGSGGWHYWFWTKYSISNSVSYLADKVDVRGTNGYVIIPPSIHKSGNRYNFEFIESIEQEIQDIPNEILKILLSRKENFNIEKKSKKIKKYVITEDLKSWSELSIKEIRELISSDKKIPIGIRNVTIHRLLSSDRANGAKGYSKLYSYALKYKKLCESHENINNEEIKRIVNSVLKYEYKNTSHKKITESYFNFLEDKGIKCSKEQKEKMSITDIDFFNLLTKEENNRNYVSIEYIQEQRDKYFESKGWKSYSKYPNHLLAAKLKEMGFERKRTNKNNRWNVKINMFIFSSYLDNIEETSNINSEMESLNMTMKVVEEQTIKIKRKHHPNEHKYPGRATQETSNAIMKLLGILEPGQLSELEDKSLILEQEATEQLFDSILPGDIFGIGQFQDGKGFVATKMKVEKIENDILYGKDVSNIKNQFDIQIGFEEVSIANVIGFAEILMRDDKPYGVDLEVEYKVRLVEEEQKNSTENDKQAETTVSETNIVTESSVSSLDNNHCTTNEKQNA